ncbi:MAG: hypothetical protein P4L85_05875 [Paludisphaera borealis]|uniref:hypothetical protein n=1 Tax=Paludisphaera borealis TaxID=1387353 RepID=UPI00284720BD|nr:hypothetical protein [Paludisphaera borealis]MDR3618861.1 hypothetical protein [Paludisphaera borealis]
MDSGARRIEEPGWDEIPGPTLGQDDVDSSTAWLDDLLASLEHDPEQSWNAFQGLEAIDPESRLQIVAELLKARGGDGLTRLLLLLGESRDEDTRAAIGRATAEAPPDAAPTDAIATTGDSPSRRVIRSLVTAVDGEGSGAIVVSTERQGVVSSAAFLCDVRKGILDVLGVAEADHAAESDLYEQFAELSSGQCVEDAPELALGLLSGSLMLSGRSTPPAVRPWLDAMLGAGFHSGSFLATKPEWASAPIDQAVLAERSWNVLEECPGWVDGSPLTFELAEEISLRERRAAADPARDSGAYRYLFERRLIHRLELYRRMLLWMAFFWDAAGDDELSLSAGILAGQLADEQYAVPAHPFAVALTTRSLHEAQRLLGTLADPRSS